jgi:hypothetical protein
MSCEWSPVERSGISLYCACEDICQRIICKRNNLQYRDRLSPRHRIRSCIDDSVLALDVRNVSLHVYSTKWHAWSMHMKTEILPQNHRLTGLLPTDHAGLESKLDGPYGPICKRIS